MGTIVHNAVVISGTEADGISRVAEVARTYGLEVVGPSESLANGYRTVLICPDGSKIGRERSDAADTMRDRLRSWLASDGRKLHWVDVCFGPDTEGAYIVGDSMAPPE